MKYLVGELEGALLDAAVAQAEGLDYEIVPQKVWGDGSGITFVNATSACRVGLNYFEPSSQWAHGGPIIEKTLIEVAPEQTQDRETIWRAKKHDEHGLFLPGLTGATPLEAAMRCVVFRALGPTVDL